MIPSASTDAASPTHVWYVEGRGPQALMHLRAHLDALTGQPHFLGAELLTSPAQPELALVASRWAAPPAPLPLPDGVRGWVFQVIAAQSSGR